MNQLLYMPLLFVYVLLFTYASEAFGQQTNPASLPVVTQAIEAIQNGETDSVIDALEELFEVEPAWFTNEQHSLAYWLGQAYFVDGFVEDASEVWNIGSKALEEADLFDPRLETALLAASFDQERKEDYAVNTVRYLNILRSLGASTQINELPQLIPFLQALLFILPEHIQEDIGLTSINEVTHYTWTSFTSTTLSTWWRSQDPAPATRVNEMLLEHLKRIAYAKKHYFTDNQFDDRGMIYIRLGEPSNKTSVQFDKSSFRNKVTDRSLTINESDFPDNEFWSYEHVDPSAHYLFHDKFGPFRIGEVANLVPISVRSGMGSSDRGLVKAKFLIRTMEEIYRQLSLYHDDYSFRYQDMASFSSLLDEAEIAEETAAILDAEDEQIEDDSESSSYLDNIVASSRGTDFAQTGLPGSSFNPNRPDLFVQSAMASDKASEELQIANREEYVPQLRSSVFDEIAPLPLLIRSARFLDPDGTTRTEIYWAASNGSLALDNKALAALSKDGYNSDDYLLVVSSVQKTADYTDRVVNYERKLLKDIGNGEDIAISNQSTVVKGDTGMYHVAVQWDQYVTLLDATGTPREMGPHVKANVYKQDSLKALIGDGTTLEMSDLKPMIVPNLASQAELTENTLSSAVPYPSTRIKNDTPIILYFELYHLAFDSDDRTRYSVEYTIQENQRTGIRLGRKPKTGTSFKSTQEGTNRTTSEQLIIDLSELRDKGTIDITVTVTDEVTKQQVRRSLSYTLTNKL